MDKNIQELIEISRQYGADPRYVIAGGGNTSYKDESRLWVKASGHALATIDEDGFAVLDRKLLAPMARRRYSSDTAIREEQVKNDLAVACLTKDRRPSVETSLHNCMEWHFIVHLHPTLVNALMCSRMARECCAELFPEALYIEYTDPGYTLFRKVYNRIKAWRAEKGAEPQVIFLQNHGIFVGADTTAEIRNIYDGIMAKLEARVEILPCHSEQSEESGSFGKPQDDNLTEFVPAVRTVLSRAGRGLKTIQVTSNALTQWAIESWDAVKEPFTPDGIVYCKSEYLLLEGTDADAAEKAIERYVARRGHTPKVILVPGVGLLAVGDNAKNARIVTEVFLDSIQVAWGAGSFGGAHPMNRRQIRFIDNWEVENYRRKVASGAARGRVEGKTIIVTGAAQGFGEGIARELIREGANIVVADLNEVTGEKTAAAFNAICGSNRAIFVKTNVAEMDSIRALIRETILQFGALDCFVSNAGVARAGDLETLTPETFEFVTKINYHAFFYCSKVASHVMKIQTARDPEYFADIIQVNSKSGLVGSKANYAYAGSKFGGIGLTQSFALELAPFRIKVNAICPGNYLDGPLWSDPEKGLFIQYLNAGKVPGAKTVADVREYYLSKVPMRKGCNPEDVCKAILYAIDQTGETGQAIPVTGGQVMLA